MRALVLAGGGAKGAYQAGVLSRLYKKGEKFDIVVGTSVGAINGFLWTYAPETIANHWLSLKARSDILSLKWWKILWGSGLYGLDPLRKRIEEILVKSNEPRCQFYPCYTNMATGDIYYGNDKLTLIDSIIASSAIPTYMEGVGSYYDGGVKEVAPVQKAFDLGATDVTVIVNNPHRKSQIDNWKSTFPAILSYGLRAVDLMQEEIIWNDMAKHKCRIFAPKEVMLDTLEFDPDKIKKAFNHGYEKVFNGDFWTP